MNKNTYKEKSKAELIGIIEQKTSKIPSRYQSQVRSNFLGGLKYKTKPELRRIASVMKVHIYKDGWGISLV